MQHLKVGVVRERGNPEGRWSAEAADLPGTLAFAEGPRTAARRAEGKALRALAAAVSDGTIEEGFLARVEKVLFGAPADVEATERVLRLIAVRLSGPSPISLKDQAILDALFRVVS